MNQPVAALLTPKVKLALCVDSQDLPLTWQFSDRPELLPIPSLFWAIQTRLVDRAVCETDTDTQQLLPYNVLRRQDGMIFTYSRGKGGDEARLHAKQSIGIGGHVDGAVPEGMTLREWLVQEAQRECQEEVGFTPKAESISFTHFICDRNDNVGSVHLGLLSIIHVDDELIQGMEAGVIEHGQWNDVLPPSGDSLFPRLENWSQIVVHALSDGSLRI